MFSPGICCICEQVPAEDCVDTARENQYMPPSPITGRKYLCATCVRAAAIELGMVSGEELAEVQDACVELHDKVKTLEAELADVRAIKAEAIKELLNATSPKPARKKVAADVSPEV